MKFTVSKSSCWWHDEDYEKEINSLYNDLKKL